MTDATNGFMIDENHNTNKNNNEPWKILIVDDDKSIHDMTKLVLSDLSFDNKSLKFIDAYSSDEAKKLIREHPDTALILLDVVMEESNSGLEFVKFLREKIQNKQVRVILRTGQPGMAPDKIVSAEYEINDYREKSELTSSKLHSAIINSLRSFKELQLVETEKQVITKRAQESIQEAEANLKLITDALPALISYVNVDGIIKFNNKTHEKWSGSTIDEINGKSIYNFWNIKEEDVFFKNFQAAINGQAVTFDYTLPHKDHGQRNVNVIFIPHRIGDSVRACFCLINDITDRKNAEETLNYLATHDNLTNTVNRRFFDVCLTHALNKAQKELMPLCVLFIDLDKFKQINDNEGHTIGDLLLIQVAERLRNCVRKRDTIARFGGDEFVVVLEEISNEEDAEYVAQKICHALAQPFFIENKQIDISASVGISIYPKDGTDKQTLLKHADMAMYQVKQTTQNNYAYYNNKFSKSQLKEQRSAIELENAIKNNELILCYQPIVDVKTKKIMSIEALVRWHHPKHGLLMPEQFLPLAEKTGLIIQLGDWVLNKACEDNVKLHQQGFAIIVSVNYSAQQFLEPGLTVKVKNVLKKTNLAGEYLALELTESILLENIDTAVSTMKALKKMGIILMLDDFGSGYSSLSYLSQLPVDAIKLDQRFIRNLPTDIANMTLISGISKMMHNLNLNIIMEGVETEQQMYIVSKLDYDQLQGYLISKPITFDEIKTMLSAEKSK